MNLQGLEHFREVWVVDFEFQQPDGERPTPLLMCAKEIRSRRTLPLWLDDPKKQQRSPIRAANDVLMVAYFASAEVGCFLALGWDVPVHILDAFTEFRCMTNGLRTVAGNGLVGALTHFGLSSIEAAEKDGMRDLAMRGGPYNEGERQDLVEYCFSDVDALERLLLAMLPEVDTPRALLRGRYMAASARMERTGVPVDTHTLSLMRNDWEDVQAELIAEIDSEYGVYEGRTFKADRFAAWLKDREFAWPHLLTGKLDLKDDTFRQMAKVHPELAPLRELRHTLSQLRQIKLPVGTDGRNRCLLSPFRARTGRNQPSNAKFIFGPSAWLRGLIKPEEGRAVAYVDYGQQEFGIAAALSGDKAMQEAYRSGDPYLAFAKQTGTVPDDATKESHACERDLFKACVLGVQYGMGEDSLALRIDKSPAHARELLDHHRKAYPTFWAWSDSVVAHAMFHNRLHTVFGWQIRTPENPNPRSLANFPMQANGAEMLRLACCLLTERGINVCAPIHDAVLIEADMYHIDEVVSQTKKTMKEASEIVLDGFPINTDVEVVKWPDRYMDKRGTRMWNTVMGILKRNSIAA